MKQKFRALNRLSRALGTLVSKKFGHSPISHKVRGNTEAYQMSYFPKICQIFQSYVYYVAKNYLPLLQQIADSLKKISLVGTLVGCTLGRPGVEYGLDTRTRNNFNFYIYFRF